MGPVWLHRQPGLDHCAGAPRRAQKTSGAAPGSWSLTPLTQDSWRGFVPAWRPDFHRNGIMPGPATRASRRIPDRSAGPVAPRMPFAPAQTSTHRFPGTGPGELRFLSPIRRARTCSSAKPDGRPAERKLLAPHHSDQRRLVPTAAGGGTSSAGSPGFGTYAASWFALVAACGSLSQ